MAFRILTEDGNYIVTEDGQAALIYERGTVESVLTPFNDERVFTSYIGGRLNGKTVVCPPENANKVKSCC